MLPRPLRVGQSGSPVSPHTACFCGGCQFPVAPAHLIISTAQPPTRCHEQPAPSVSAADRPLRLFGWQTASSPCVPDSLQKWSSSFCLLENLVKPPPDSFASRSYRNARLLVSARQRNKTRKSRKTSMVSLFGPDLTHLSALVLFCLASLDDLSSSRPWRARSRQRAQGFPARVSRHPQFQSLPPPISPHLSFLPSPPPLPALCSAAAAAFMSSISVPQAEKAPCVLH